MNSCEKCLKIFSKFLIAGCCVVYPIKVATLFPYLWGYVSKNGLIVDCTKIESYLEFALTDIYRTRNTGIRDEQIEMSLPFIELR